MKDNDHFYLENDLNRKETRKKERERLSLEDLRRFVELKFTSYREASQKVGISETRLRQILIGHNPPKSAKMILQIAEGLGVDQIKLAILFSSIYKEEEIKNNVEAELQAEIKQKEGQEND